MPELLPGTEVQARGLRWQVVYTQQLGPQTLYRLRGLEAAVRGHELDFLAPFEPLEPIIHQPQPDRAGPLRQWLVYHQAFLLEQALGADALLAIQPGRLYLEPYQLVPVLRAIRMSRPRLLLADGVGLGKTIQAGLILTELVARRMANRILIVSPAGPLLEQWKLEMSERFGLRLTVIDRNGLEEVRRRQELGANPFDHLSLGLASIDFLKQESVLEQLERTTYDVAIIDEAHHCMDLGAAGEREDTQRRRLAAVLARQCDALLLLTATPHDGNDRSFASLCELLDPSLVNGKGELRGLRYRDHVVRRLKKHITNPQTGQSLFKERIVTPVPVRPSQPAHTHFVDLQRALLDLIAPELRRAFRARKYSDVLSFIALLKRSVSTVAACQRTLEVVANRFQRLVSAGAESQESRRQRLTTLREYQRKLARFGALSAEEEQEQSLLEAEELAQRLADLQRAVRRGSHQLKQQTDVVAALDDLQQLAEDALPQDPKLDQLLALITAIRSAEPHANILVYTEYVDSQRAVVAALQGHVTGGVITLSGLDPDADRKERTDLFRTQRDLILVSTDTAAEGLNLHERCHHLIHLELPFNPNRLEQRNGRIDRYGQAREPHVYYLYLANTFEERILLRLIAKYERQRALLTFVPNTLGITTASDAATERLLAGIMDEDEQLFQSEPAHFDFVSGDENAGADDATRELLEEIDRSLRGYREAARTNNWLGEAGLNAEGTLLQAAATARDRGERINTVDLARFVADAVQLDGGQLTGAVGDPVFQLRVPHQWVHGLEELPGYNPHTGTLFLTTSVTVTRDAHNNTVGFLGRAHPLVRRALDRVRSLAFGQTGQSQLDLRVSAVNAPVDGPALLCTFLGRVTSRAGRELEQVLAVQIDAAGQTHPFAESAAWLPLADLQHAINPAGLWRTHFATWGDEARRHAHALATAHFQTLAATVQSERQTTLEREATSLEQWLDQRATELTGAAQPPAPVQVGLFETVAPAPAGAAPSWQTLTAPHERLAAFAADRSQPPARRSEADGVLRLYDGRRTYLADRLAFNSPEVAPLGLLMLLPE